MQNHLKERVNKAMSGVKKGIYYREGNHEFTHCHWMINYLENDERTIKVYFLNYSEGDERNLNDYEVYDSQDYKEIEEQLRVLRMKYPKVIKVFYLNLLM